jgi:hypothetical protein
VGVTISKNIPFWKGPMNVKDSFFDRGLFKVGDETTVLF